MDVLWAPWRMEYVGGGSPPGCLFCRVVGADPEGDRDSLVVQRGPLAIAMLNKFPYNPGHLMVAPRRHVPSLVDLGEEDTVGMMDLVRRSLRALEAALHPDGFNVGANLGRTAGAGIPGHVHLHVVPRWDGDTNFMPVVAETKVIPEHLDRTLEQLWEAFVQSP